MSSDARRAAPWIDFEWATIRLVPHVHRGERVNVGVIVHARTASFLKVALQPPWALLAAFAPALGRPRLERHFDAYRRVAEGDPEAGPVALLPPSERFHWLTAPRSAIIQTSRVHGGRAHDLDVALAALAGEQCHPSSTPSRQNERPTITGS